MSEETSSTETVDDVPVVDDEAAPQDVIDALKGNYQSKRKREPTKHEQLEAQLQQLQGWVSQLGQLSQELYVTVISQQEFIIKHLTENHGYDVDAIHDLRMAELSEEVMEELERLAVEEEQELEESETVDEPNE